MTEEGFGQLLRQIAVAWSGWVKDRYPPAKTDNSNINEEFIWRHIGPDAGEIEEMVHFLGHSSLDSLIDAVVPPYFFLSSYSARLKKSC